MKKILTILAVALLSTVTVFAVSFGGKIDTGAAINFDNNAWNVYHYGNDGVDTLPARINLSVADDNGLWSASFGTTGKLNSAGKFGANLTFNLSKAFGDDLPVDVKVSTTYDDRYTALRAYANKSGNNLDRARTIGGTTHFAATVAYEKIVTVAASYNAYIGGKNAITVSALSEPYSGIKVSAAYVLGGENKAGDWAGLAKPDTDLVAGAVDINVGKLADLDFDLGVAVSERYQFADSFNTLAAVVYGGVDMVSAYAEYGLLSYNGGSKHVLEVGADVKLDAFEVKAWFGANDLATLADTYFVGGSVGTKLSGVGLTLGVQYSATDNDSFKEYGKYKGLQIIPSISVSF